MKWEIKSSDTLKKVVVPVRDAVTGQIKVPDAECIAEYIMVMAIGDTKARPKGGTAKYCAAWHHAQQPRQLHMRAREQGRGAYADTPMRFVSIEKMQARGIGAVLRQASAGVCNSVSSENWGK